MTQEVYSICSMCTVHCPIRVLVENDEVVWIEGNPYVPGIEGALCAKGAAGIAFQNNPERPQYPMIRTGARGAGQWRQASWDEALDYVADKLKATMAKYGPESLVFGERVNFNTHISKTFMKALGSPNHFTHDVLCKDTMDAAFRTLTGYTEPWVGIDYANTKHIILYGRNIFESLEIKAINDLLSAMDKGAKLTCIDPRFSITASKADRYWMIRPGADLALNYALIHVILQEDLYDRTFAIRWFKDQRQELPALKKFVEPYTPAWAEQETGIPAQEIIDLAREVAADKPSVVFHYSYRAAHHTDEIYLGRSIIILNALMGSLEAKGGLFFKKGIKAAGHGNFSNYDDQKFPKITAPRFDGGGAMFPIADFSHGNPHMLAHAILKEDPYPIKALIVNRFGPLQSIADSEEVRRALEKLDLIVAIDVTFSEIARFADVILPESMYLERADSIQRVAGLKPQLFIRKQAVAPRYDTKPGWWILNELGKRLDLGEYFPFETIEDIWNFQLHNVGVKIEEFDPKGFVTLIDEDIWWDRDKGIQFKTPSGKFEFFSYLMENAGFPSFVPYTPVAVPPAGFFRLTVGRVAAQTQAATQNLPYLKELIPENELWINTKVAAELGIKDGSKVEVASRTGADVVKARVTDFIHPEAVFMLHGFQARCYKQGAGEALRQENIADVAGGSPAQDETLVQVRPVI